MAKDISLGTHDNNGDERSKFVKRSGVSIMRLWRIGRSYSDIEATHTVEKSGEVVENMCSNETNLQTIVERRFMELEKKWDYPSVSNHWMIKHKAPPNWW